ncbi:hypothetical protein L21SP3_02082 [Sedimentisphaera cyanobacteriorum]|uniref:LamG-like jellyroll fold domain-containing protein n=1 Tax=Sedimentisphaera cyanobacteriorum TaxID=1940790 RepID=A0A1Q2HSL0_9BACT|nr:LamG-like jellyroll fold domain-containing protein [Sedimentisphaera cyanobacteriorum]AQQ10254.1 hypothetical protein L21SP3_02082 [Sedimentisphaera cyanobacteriorum]
MNRKLVSLLSFMVLSYALLASPVALQHISFDDNFGNAVYVDDEGGVAGAIDYVTGAPVGKGAEFTNPTEASQGDYLKLSQIMEQKGTVAMWLNIDQSYNYQNIWDCGTGSWQWEMYNDETGTFFTKIDGWPGCRMYEGSDYSLDSWFHYAWTWDTTSGSAVCKLYINGVEVDSVTQNSAASGSSFNVGAGLEGNFKYNGMMDEFYIMDSVMEPNDIMNSFVNPANEGTLATNPYPYVSQEVETDSVTLSWDAPSGAASPSYNVYFKEGDSDFTAVTPVSTASSSINKTVSNNNTYYWRVDVVDGDTTYEGIVWQFSAALEDDLPVAAAYLPFEDNRFGGVDYIDDQGGVAGDIAITDNGVIGKYANFVNPNDPAQGDSLYAEHPGESGTVAMWAKYADTAAVNSNAVLWDASVAGNDWKLYPAGTSLYARLAASQWAPNITTLETLTDWFHIAWTWEKTGEKAETILYIDGVEVSTEMQNLDAHSDAFKIGGGFSWYPKFDGGMDEAYLFENALNADQVAALITDAQDGVLATNPIPSVSETVYNEQTALSWTAPASVTSPSYNVYVAADEPVFSNVTPVVTTETSIDITVETATTYYWKVEVVEGSTAYSPIIWQFDTMLGNDLPVALAHVSFEDDQIKGVAYVDDQGDAEGDIVITENGIIGKYGNFTNPNTNPQGDSLYAEHPGESGSVAMWAKYADTAAVNSNAVLWDASVAGNDWKLYPAGTSLYARLAASQWAPNITTLETLTDWFHIVWTWDKTGLQADTVLYINGVEVSSEAQNFDAHADVFRIGGGFSWYPKFDGGMDEVYLFDRALTADQVTSLITDAEDGILATNPQPAAGQVTASQVSDSLSWTAPSAVTAPTYNVYFSTNPTLPADTQVAAGISATSVAVPDGCVEGKRYYWRVDVVDGDTTNTGIVWSFKYYYLDTDLNKDAYVNNIDYAAVADNYNKSNLTVGTDMPIDDFESYASTSEMNANWQIVPNDYFTVVNVGQGELGLLGTGDPNYAPYNGDGALKLTYDFTDGGADWAIADFMYEFDTPQDLSAYDEFEMWVNFGEANSKEQYFYVKLFQGGIGCGGTGGDDGDYRLQSPSLYIAETPDATTNQSTGWKKITGDLTQYSDLTDIHGFQIGCSSAPFTSDAFGTGTIFFDDIKFVFIPECTAAIEGDFNDDCEVNMSDVKQLSEDWLK